jgi:hypothetical protein
MLADNDFTHVICGYSAASSIKRAFKIAPANIIKCGDLIAVGQQNLHHDYSKWSKARIPALEAALDAGLSDMVEPDEPFDLFHNFSALHAGKPVLIWLDCSVASQLTAGFLCHVFKCNGWDLTRLHELPYAKVPELYMGILGVLNDKELHARRPEVRKLMLEEIDLYAEIWIAFAGSGLPQLVSMISDKKASSLTMDALPYLARRLPSLFNGLNEIDHELLKHIIDSAPSAIHAIGFAMGHDETPDMVGDLYLFARLKHFGSPDLINPLIEIENPTGRMRECKIRVLPLAHEVLAGRANMIDLNGLDYWLGGVHLTADNVVYREDLAATGSG